MLLVLYPKGLGNSQLREIAVVGWKFNYISNLPDVIAFDCKWIGSSNGYYYLHYGFPKAEVGK